MINILFLIGFVPLAISIACPSYAMKRAWEPDTDSWEIFVNEILAKKTELKLHWEDEDDRGDHRQENNELSLSSDNDILRLAKAIKSKDGLTNFVLSCACCNNSGAFAMAEALRSLRNLTKLFLELWPEQINHDDINGQGTEAIIDAIKFLPLHELKLNLPFDDKSSQALSKLIEHNSILQSLYIESLQYKKGAYFILKALANNKTITVLEFFFVDSQSMLPLAEVIRNNSTITTLKICDEHEGELDDFSFRAFFGAIAANKTITTLSLSFMNQYYFGPRYYDNQGRDVNIQDRYNYNQMQIIIDAHKSNKALTRLNIPWLNEPSVFEEIEIIRSNVLLQIQPILDKNKAWPDVKFTAFAICSPEGKFYEFPPEIRRILLQKFSALWGAL